MKKKFLVVFILIASEVLFSQEYDLNYYIEQAKDNSPLIKQNKKDAELLSLDLEQIKTILSKPEINLEARVLFAPIISHDKNSSGFEWVSEGANDYTGYDLAFSDGGQYQAVISVKQPIFTGSIYKNYADNAAISKRISKNKIDLTQHEIEQLVCHQYLLCLKSKNQKEISLELIKKLEEQIKIVEQLVQHAIYKQTDLKLLQIEIQNYILEYKTYDAGYKNNLADLNILCGIENQKDIELVSTNFEIRPDTIATSHFLNSFTLDSLSIQSDQILFEQKYKPRLNLFADAGLNAIYIPSFNRFGFSTGLSFIWNIFDGNQKRIQQDKTKIKLDIIEFNKNRFKNNFSIYKEKFLNRIKDINERIQITENQLIEYKKLLDLYNVELTYKQVSIMDFKNIFRDIGAKKQENTVLKMEKQALINSYNYWNY